MNNPLIVHNVALLKNEYSDVRSSAARALGEIGNSVTLPRKVLASSRFSAQERIEVLDTLRRVHGYKFDATRTLCQTILTEENTEARDGAQTVLNWLDGERELLLASMPASPTNKDLLIAYQGGPAETCPETLLLPSSEPEQDIVSGSPQPSRWQRLTGKQK